MSDDISQEAISSWNEVVRLWKEHLLARYNLYHNHRTELLALVSRALYSPDAAVAFDIASTLTPEEKRTLLPKLLNLCSSGHAGNAKEMILEMPHDWLVENIEAASEPTLALNDFLDWVNILEVYDRIDQRLGRRLAERMIAHSDPDLKEWGAEFLEKEKGERA
jgi:hypothetical protein